MYIRIRIRIRTPRDAFIHSFDTSTEDLLASNSDFEEMLRGDPAHSRSAIVLYCIHVLHMDVPGFTIAKVRRRPKPCMYNVARSLVSIRTERLRCMQK